MTDAARPAAWRDPLIVAVLALGVRAWVLSDMLAANPLFQWPILDDAAYLAIAKGGAGDLGTFMAPLYPWVLRRAGALFDIAMPLACWLSVVVGVGTAALSCVVARKLHSAQAGLLAGVAYAVLGCFVMQDVAPGQEPLLAFVTLLALLFALRLRESGGPRDAAAAGACTGFAFLGRGTAVVALLALLPSLRGRTPLIRLGGAALAGVLGVLAGFGGLLAVSGADMAALPWSLGTNLYATNGPEAREHVTFRALELGGKPETYAANSIAIARSAAARELSHAEVSRYWVDRTWRERGSVGELAGHVVKKAGLFFAYTEIGGNHSSQESRFSTWLSLVGVRAWWLLALAGPAWWLLRSRRPGADCAAWIIAGHAASLAVFFPVGRYRMTAVTVALVLVACALVEVLRERPERRRLLVAGALFVSTTVVAFLPIRPPDPGAIYHFNVAVARHWLEQPRGAVQRDLETAVQLDPSFASANELLGFMHLEAGRPEAARGYLEAAALSPDPVIAPVASAELIRAHVEAGDAAAAEAEYQRFSTVGRVTTDHWGYGSVAAVLLGEELEGHRRLSAAWHQRPDAESVQWARERIDLTDAQLEEIMEGIRELQRANSGER